MKEFSKYIGMDVHKMTIAVSVADAQGGEAVNRPRKMLRGSPLVPQVTTVRLTRE